MMLDLIRAELAGHASESQAAVARRFFKTGPGEYAEGDQFIGVRVPAIRRIARKYRNLELDVVENLLQSKIHEERLLALVILTGKYMRGKPVDQRQIFELYMSNLRHINNWDLVDVSAEHIVGAFLHARSHETLYKMARSTILWERRIAIMSTFHYVKKHEFAGTIAIAEMLLGDKHDLIHKAVGWMLREIGNRDRATEEMFLKEHYNTMPRTMLRYAIERFPEELRLQYLHGSA